MRLLQLHPEMNTRRLEEECHQQLVDLDLTLNPA